MLSYYYC